MDPPPIDPPPVPAATTITPPVAAPAPLPPTAAQHHPPYAEMITAAITALNEREGSSKRAIAKYIEAHYTGLPPTHASLLTTHLKRLKTNGQLQMVKYSYALPGSAPAIAPLVSANGAVSSDAPKRRPGRPPKLRPASDAIQPAVPVFPAPAPAPVNLTNNNNVPPVNPAAPPQATFAAAPTGPVNGPAVPVASPPRDRGGAPLKRGRGRPKKNSVAAGPTAVVAASGGGGRGRGRPRKNVDPAGRVGVGAAPPTVAAPIVKGPGRPRGRPPKPINVAPVAVTGQPAAAAPVVVGVKRRGRPPKAESGASGVQQQQPKKSRKLSGKPLGRPRKDATANVNQTPDSQLLVAYLDMKAKLDNLHAKIQQTVSIVKPCLDNEAAIHALQELEIVAATSVSAPPSAQSQQPLPQPQPEQPPAQQFQIQS